MAASQELYPRYEKILFLAKDIEFRNDLKNKYNTKTLGAQTLIVIGQKFLLFINSS